MPIDIQKPKGPTKRNSPTAGGANPRLAPVLGIVKDTVDPQRMGRIFVYITDNSGLDPENRDNWRPVRFLSPFFGATRPDSGNDGNGNFKGNPSSYGMWMAQPDIGTTVVCLFIDGDMNYGFYIGCVPEPEALQMVPAIGATENVIPNQGESKSYGGAPRLPVTNINTNNASIADSTDYLSAPKPVHSYSAAIMFQQGIIRDPIRGPISSSSQRETPSRVGWGVSTPGRPIYQGGFDDSSIATNLSPDKAKDLRVVARRGGHSIVMDDGDIIGRDQLVRIRTALGHQILMSDDGQTLMILHSNGQSYVELGKEGTVDVYSTNSVNVRTQGDLNLHADNNININAQKKLSIQAESIQINTEKEFKQRVGTDHSVSTGGKFGHKVTGTTAFTSGGAMGLTSGSAVSVKGSRINLNSGSGPSANDVPPVDKILHTDTLFDATKGFLAAPAKLSSIVSRAPAHAPWASAGQGVNVKTNLDSNSQLPASPKSSVVNTNNIAASSLTSPVSNAVVASAPPIPNISNAINDKTGQALAATAAADAKSGPFSDAVTKGTAIANTATGVQVAAGAAIPQTAEQMQQAGVLKPGSATLINSIAASTGNAKAAFPNTVFASGNLSSFVSSAQAQTISLSKSLQVMQIGLQQAGVITGAETGSQIGGLIYSAAKNGLSETVGAVGLSANSSVATNNSTIVGITNKGTSVMGDIAKGNFASGLAAGSGGALSGLQNSLGGLSKIPSVAASIDRTKGASAAAFSAISSSMKPMKANEPQNLAAIATQNAVQTTVAGDTTNNSVDSITKPATSTISNIPTGSTTVSTGLLPNAGTIASSLINAVKNSNSTVAAISSIPTIVSDLATASIVSTAKSIITSTASGLSALPGGASAVSSVTNLLTGSVPPLPGTSDLKSAMTGTSVGTMNNISNTVSSAASSLLTSVKSGKGLASVVTAKLPPSAAAALQSAVSSIASAGNKIKIPSVALNTTNRSSITAATANQLGDPSIPTPNFSATPPSSATIQAIKSYLNT